MRIALLWAWAALALPLVGAERKLDFSDCREGQAPTNFHSCFAGAGRPGDWRIVLDETSTALQPLTPQAAAVMKRPVLAQLAQDPTDEHFCLFVLEDEVFDDFKLTTQFKTVRGTVEQMAGVAFRIQNETNYYVVRASSLGNTFRFYRVRDGVRSQPVGPELPIPSGVWHEMAIECKANTIRAALDGKEYIVTTDEIKPYLSGKIGYWTKSDSVSYFYDTRIVYEPHVAPLQKILAQVLKSYPNLVALQVFMPDKEPGSTRLVASKNVAEIGRAGAEVEREVIKQGIVYYGKETNTVSVVLPMRDRNGDPVAAVRVVMKSFPGETQAAAVSHAKPIVGKMEDRVQEMQDVSR